MRRIGMGVTMAMLAMFGMSAQSAQAQNLEWDGTYSFDLFQSSLLFVADSVFDEDTDLEDVSGDADPEEGIPEIAEFRLFEAILTETLPAEAQVPFQQDIIDAFIAVHPIADSKGQNTDLGALPTVRVQGAEFLATFLIRNRDGAVLLGEDFGIEDDNAFTAQDLAAIDAAVAPFAIGAGLTELSASGDLDNDNVTNLAEWESTSGVADFNERVSQFISVATAGAQAVTTVGPTSSTIFETQTVQLTASSTDDQGGPIADTFTWESSDESVATVSATGLVTGVDNGTATITATGDTSGASGEATVTVQSVLTGLELCSLDDVFRGQGELLAGFGEDLGLPTSYDEWDIELGTGDGALDSFQMEHLAFVLCQSDSISKTDEAAVANVAAQFGANLAEIEAFTAALADVPDFADTIGPELTDAATVLSTVFTAAGGAGEIPAMISAFESALTGLVPDPTGTATTLVGGMDAVAAQLGGAAVALPAGLGGSSEFAELAPNFVLLDEFLAGFWGLSTEMKLTLGGLLDSLGLTAGDNAVAQLNSLETDVVSTLGLYAMVFAGIEAGFTSITPTDVAAMGAAATNVSDAVPDSFDQDLGAPYITVPDPVIYTLGTKAPGEPFSGAGDFDGDGTTNGEVSGFVVGAGGDSQDYVFGVTGEFGPFWAGNPALPVGGGVALVTLLGALGAAGAMTIRRKK